MCMIHFTYTVSGLCLLQWETCIATVFLTLRHISIAAFSLIMRCFTMATLQHNPLSNFPYSYIPISNFL
ncbi:hypothetical protein XENTR_v10014492 [Xenopus tropicalis]|nr:hypothetical protein XENTR_v10014492 [Xenopus tropicalis]